VDVGTYRMRFLTVIGGRTHPPSPSLATNTLWTRRSNLSRTRGWIVGENLATAFTPVFNFHLIFQATGLPWPECEAMWTLLGAMVTQWSFAIVRPE
jgi:hypothetical protein